MAQETQLLKLDLDNAEFNAKVDAADKKISGLGDGSKLDGLIDGITSASKILGVVGSVAAAAKVALDLTLEAEQVKQVNQQFEILTRNAGISGETLSSALIGISEGLVDDEELLKATGEAVVRLGKNAEKLPQVFELAKNMTRAFGGELLDNYSRLYEAISTGNVKALRSVNIIVDQEKAMLSLSKAINKNKDDFTQAEKQMAVMNAVIERGKIAFEGIDGSVVKTTESWQRLKVALGEVKESSATVFDRVFGPFVRETLRAMGEGLTNVSLILKEKFASGADSSQAKLELMRKELESLDKQTYVALTRVGDLSKTYGEAADKFPDFIAAKEAAAGLAEQTNKVRNEVEALSKQVGADKKTDESGRQVASDEATSSQRLAVASKFETDLLNMRLARMNQEIEVSQSVAEVEQLQIERVTAMKQLEAAKEAEIQDQLAQKKISEMEAEGRLVEYRKALIADLRRVEQKAEDERINALKNLANATGNTAQGFVNGFKFAAANSSKELFSFSKMGAASFDSLKRNATSAFMELGKGTKSAADVMKGFFLGALADMAESQGALLLANITNPAGMAAGAGLMILAGVLRGLAGDAGAGGSKGIGAASASGGGGAVGSISSVAEMERPQVEEARRKREVQLVIQGSYFETEQTKRTLMEMIRSETDATGFSYVQIGQGA